MTFTSVAPTRPAPLESDGALIQPRPTVAICAALVRARWGAWDRPAYLLAQEYVTAVRRAGALAVPTGFEPATSALTGRRALQTALRDLR